jgi:hypothetical protein
MTSAIETHVSRTIIYEAATPRSKNTAFSVFSWSTVRFSNRVIIFCGGSFTTNNGFRLGSTSAANWVGDRMCAITKTFGRMLGKSCWSFIYRTGQVSNRPSSMSVQPTSSNNDGRILRTRNPSENLLSTLVRPFMKEIFSSLDLAAKFDLSKKFKVDMGSDEKNEWVGRVVGVRRF